MKLIVTRIGVKKEKMNRNRKSVRLRTKVLTALAGTAMTLAVCFLAERLPEKTIQVFSGAPVQDGFLLPAVCYEDCAAELLAEDLRLLKEIGCTPVTCSEAVSMARGLTELPEKPVLLVFGGSGREILTDYLPVLEQYGMKGSAVICGGDADLYSDSVPKTGEAKLSWNEIRTLERSGLVETVSMGYSLCRLKKMPSPQEWTADLLTMQTRMNEELYHDASAYFCPFGDQEGGEEALRELGFLTALEEGDDIACIGSAEDLLDVEYISRGHEPSAEFFAIGR